MLVASATASPRAGRFLNVLGKDERAGFEYKDAMTAPEPAEKEMLCECSAEGAAADHDDVEGTRIIPRIISSNVGPRIWIGAGFSLGEVVTHVAPWHVSAEVRVLREHIVAAWNESLH